MPSYPKVRALTEHERTILEHRTKSENTEHSKIARIILISAEGRSLEETGDSVGAHSETVRRWIMKFNRKGLEGITPAKRGPKLRFTAEQREKIVRIAHTPPGQLGQSFSEWTSVKLAKYLSEQGIVGSISHVSVRQILRESEPALGPQPRTIQPRRAVVAARTSAERGLSQTSETDPSGPDTPPEPVQVASARNEEVIADAKQALASRKFELAINLLTPLLEEPDCVSDREAEVRCLLCIAYQGKDQYSRVRQLIEVYESPERRANLSPRMIACVRLRLGWMCNLTRDYPRAFARFNEALPAFVELRDAQGSSETHYALGRTYYEINEYKIARDHLLEAVHYQRFENDRQLLAEIYFTLGLVDYYEGDFASAKAHYQKALELARYGPDHKLLGQLSVDSGLVCMYDSFPDRALASQRFREAIAHFEQADEWDYVCLAYNNLADNLIHSGEWNEGEECLLSALETAVARNASKYQAIALATLGELASFRGQYARAKQYLGRCLELLPQVGSKWVEGVVELVLGTFYALVGDHNLSRDHLNASLQISTSLGNPFNRSLAHVLLGELFLADGEVRLAREHLRTAGEAAKESASLVLSGRLKRLNGLIDAAEGFGNDGIQHLFQSVAAFATAQDVFEEARSRLELGKALLAAGEEESAGREMEQALKAFERLEAAPYIEAARNIAHDRTGHAQDVTSPFEVSRARPSGSQGFAVAPCVSKEQTAPQSDFIRAVTPTLLMERLLEAASSPELLLQELASITEYVFHSLPPVGIGIYRILDGDELQPLIVKGSNSLDAEALRSEIREALVAGRSHTTEGKVAVLLPGERESLAVHISTGSGPTLDLDPIRPFLKQAELILENYALRSLKRSGVAPRSEAVKYSVREALPGFLYASQAMAEVIERIHKIRRSDVTVLITGESGTGKELVARTIHAESARRTAIFLPFNCTAVSPELVESQLFGHRRGSFTGAVNHYQGIVRAAEGGTLFLDEIGDLSLTVQPKLLRFLQESEIQPVGQAKPEKVDVRVITATNTDLEKAVAQGRFREDLYHRLNIIRLHVPALRERLEEVPVLAEHYLQYFAKRSGRSGLAFDRDVLDLFLEYDWPGNVRQLRNEIERAVAYAGSDETIKPEDLSPEILRSRRGSFPRFESGRSESLGPAQRSGREEAASGRAVPALVGGESRTSSLHREARSQPMPLDQAAPATPSKHGSGSRWLDDRAETNAPPPITTPSSLKEATEQLERQMIADALRRHRHNVTKTAQELGMSRRGLRLKIDQLRIEI